VLLSRGILRLRTLACSLMLTLSGLFCMASAQASTGPASVAFWYAAEPPLPELAQHDWVVLESGHVQPDQVAFLQAQGAVPFAYLSVGELSPEDEASADAAQLSSGERNHEWQSDIADLASPQWQQHLLERAARLRSQGYRGLFLDTLDSFMRLPEERRPAQLQGLVALLQRLHAEYPDLQLFFNRGFEALPELGFAPAAVAVESLEASWDQAQGQYGRVSESDRAWLDGQLKPLLDAGTPVVAIEYLPPEQREQARELSQRLQQQGYLPVITTPELDSLGVGTLEVVPRRIALLYDPREGELTRSPGHVLLGGLLEYLGYRVDYFAVDGHLPERRFDELYAGVVVWMTSGAPAQAGQFRRFLQARLNEGTRIAFFGGMPVDDARLLARLGLRRLPYEPREVSLKQVDAALVGSFEAPLRLRARDLLALSADDKLLKPALQLQDEQSNLLTPVATADWGGYAQAPYLFQESASGRRWMLDPFSFLQASLQLPPLPALDVTTENGRRIATVHIDGDGFASRAEVPGTPYSGEVVLQDYIRAHDFLTSVSVIEGEVGPQGMYPYLTKRLEPIARRIFADPKVEPATHTFSHPFFWEPEKASQREGFTAEYGMNMAIPNYPAMNLEREIIGSRDYIQRELLPADKQVRLIFWSGEALPSAEAIGMAYAAGMANVNGAETYITRANPSLSGLYPLLRPTSGGLQIYAPIINENLYTNLWTGPFYGFERVLDTFELTDSPRRLRGLNLYYHFYSGTKQASIKAMGDVYAAMQRQQPISLWMGDYLRRVRGLYEGGMARRADGRWQLRALQGLRTVRLDPQLGWPDLLHSEGVAGVRDLPQGRYVHLSRDRAVLALQPARDTAPALEYANVPLQAWEYRGEREVRVSMAGQFALRFAVRYAGNCSLSVGGRRYEGQRRGELLEFNLERQEVSDAVLACR